MELLFYSCTTFPHTHTQNQHKPQSPCQSPWLNFVSDVLRTSHAQSSNCSAHILPTGTWAGTYSNESKQVKIHLAITFTELSWMIPLLSHSCSSRQPSTTVTTLHVLKLHILFEFLSWNLLFRCLYVPSVPVYELLTLWIIGCCWLFRLKFSQCNLEDIVCLKDLSHL